MLLFFTSLFACAAPTLPLSADSPPDFTYLLSVAAFQDSDGDGVGDLQGVRWHIQHIRSLGVETVQLLPIEPGWDPGRMVPNGAGVDPLLGTLDDLADLADDLHRNGLRLEIQVPLDAVGRGHPWFGAALRGEGRLELGSQAAVDWYPVGRGWYYYASGGAGQPDLDWDDAGLPGDRAEQLLPLLSAGVDGVLLRPFQVEGERPAIEVASALCGELNAAELATCASAPAESVVDALEPWTSIGPVADLPRALALESAGVDGDVSWLSAVIQEWGPSVDQTRPFLGDADRSRFATRLSDAELRRTLMVLHLLGPGHPALYYGEELDMVDASTEPVDAPWRDPMPWDATRYCGFAEDAPWFTPDPACKVGRNAYDEARDPDSMLALVRWLGQQRRRWGSAVATPLGTGFTDTLEFRAGDLLVVGNVGPVARVVDIPSGGGVDLRSGARVEGEITVPARSWRVLRAGGGG